MTSFSNPSLSSTTTLSLSPTAGVQSQESPGLASAATTTFFAGRDQHQPAPQPLSETHALTTDIATDVDLDILDTTFRELFSSGNPSNSSVAEVDPMLESAFSQMELEERLDNPSNSSAAEVDPMRESAFRQMELEEHLKNSSNSLDALDQLEINLSLIEQLAASPETKAQMESSAWMGQALQKTGELINNLLHEFISFFNELLDQPASSLPSWIKSQLNYINQSLPFSCSKLLQDKLPKLTVLGSFLNDELARKWAQNYPLCVAKLKENGLQAYIDQKSEKSFFSKIASSSREALINNFLPMLVGCAQDQLRTISTELMTFNNEIIKRKDDPNAIKLFIDEAGKRSDYSYPFALRNILTTAVYPMTAYLVNGEFDLQGVDKWLESDIQCEQIMRRHELVAYFNEKPGDCQMQSIITEDMLKNQLQQMEEKIPLFNQLLAELEKKSIDRPMIEKILFEHREVFFEIKQLKSTNMLMKDSSTPPVKIIELYTECCFKLIDAKFKHPSFLSGKDLQEYIQRKQIQGMTNMPFSSTTPSPASSSNPALTVADQIKLDQAFFIKLLAQDDDSVEAWLKENNGNDYLVRGKQNRAQFNDLFQKVDRGILVAWLHVYEASIEKLRTEKLKHLLPQ